MEDWFETEKYEYQFDNKYWNASLCVYFDRDLAIEIHVLGAGETVDGTEREATNSECKALEKAMRADDVLAGDLIGEILEQESV